jgi:hypothetical protein
MQPALNKIRLHACVRYTGPSVDWTNTRVLKRQCTTQQHQHAEYGSCIHASYMILAPPCMTSNRFYMQRPCNRDHYSGWHILHAHGTDC